jgi:hypothetical protein
MIRISVFTLLLLLAAAMPAICADTPGAAGPTVAVGADFRLRLEGLNNALDLNSDAEDSYGFFRMRSRISIDAKQGDDLRVYFRLANEYRWGRGELVSGLGDPTGKLSVDNGYIDIRVKPVPGLRARFGRQDLMYGEGFLIFDGTPADGSGSAYFDALKLSYAPCPAHAVDLFMAKIEAEGFPGATSPPGGSENIYGLYGMWTPPTNRKGDLYVLYHDKRDPTRTGSGTVLHLPQKTAAFGGRYAILPATGVRLSAEGAAQTGRYAGRYRRAFGGTAHGGWIAPAATHLGLEVGGVYLSGGRQGTGRYEGWDDFASEWPKYSELYIYTVYDALTRIRPDDAGAWTNLAGVWGELRANPVPRITALLRATRFGAPMSTGPGSGRVRGMLYAGTLNLDLGSNLKGQALGEVFAPGSFYVNGSDTATYGRVQLTAGF